VPVGGGKPADAAALLAGQPVVWAAVVGLVLSALRIPLPDSVRAEEACLLTRALATVYVQVVCTVPLCLARTAP